MVGDRSTLIGAIRVAEVHLGFLWVIVCKPLAAKLRGGKEP